jgi:dihydroorotase
MAHIGGVETRALMSEILDLLRPGDILTHCYTGAPNLTGDFTNIVQDGRLLPAALAANQRGVVFDVGHGRGSFDYTLAEAAIAQGCPPDTISLDIHVVSGNTPGVPYLTWVMSKFLGLGFPLEKVVAMARSTRPRSSTASQSSAPCRSGHPGCSDHGAGRGSGQLCRHRNNTRNSTVHLQAVQTVTVGVPFGRPDNMPFAVK